MKSPAEYLELVNFFASSLATAGAIALGGSQVGPFVMFRREGMLALALPQVVAVGVALSLRWGLGDIAAHHSLMSWLTLVPPLIASILGMLILAWSRRHGANHWVLPSLFVGGMSLSFLIIANAGAHVEEMQQYFTGMEVAVSAETAMVIAPIALIVGWTTALLWRRWLALAQAPAATELAGLNPARWDVLFLCLLATLLLFGTAALGAVMVLAMLFLPAATVAPWTRRIPVMLFASAVTSLLFLAIGFVLSIEMEWPLSHSIAGAGFILLMASHLIRGIA